MAHKFLKIINHQGSIQLTDEASAYYFLYMKFKLGLMYINSSANCRCTWSDGTETGTAYNYCLLNNSNNICVIKNPSDSEVRVAVAPMNFTGDASFNICCTGCEKEIADNLDVYIFSPADNFTPGKSGLQLYDSSGKLIYDSSWRPLKITKQAQSADGIEESFSISENYGVVLNSGYRKPSDTEYVIGTFLINSGSDVWTSLPSGMGSFTNAASLRLSMTGGRLEQDIKRNNYYSTTFVKTFPDTIQYQGFALSKNYVRAQKYTAWSPRDSKTYKQTTSKSEQVLEDVEYQEWDTCATETSEWDNCATKTSVYDSCATKTSSYDSCATKTSVYDSCATKTNSWNSCLTQSSQYNSTTGKWETVCRGGFEQKCQGGFVEKCQGGYVEKCQGGFVEKCQGGLVKKCQAGFVTKTKKEWHTVTVTITDEYLDVYPTLDNPSLMYGMEIYPDGTLFTRTSGLSTIGIVDLTNY